MNQYDRIVDDEGVAVPEWNEPLFEAERAKQCRTVRHDRRSRPRGQFRGVYPGASDTIVVRENADGSKE